MQRVGDVMQLDRREIRLLVREEARVRRPPESVRPVHFLLRDELRFAVRERRGCTMRKLEVRARRDVDHVELAVAQRRDARAVRRELRRKPTSARQRNGAARRALHDEQLAAERHENLAPVLGELEAHEPPRGDALALAARLFLGAQALFSAPQQLGRDELALGARRDGELVEALDRVARPAAQVEHGGAVRRGRRLHRLAERVVARRGDVREATVFLRGRDPRGEQRRARERHRSRAFAARHSPRARSHESSSGRRSARIIRRSTSRRYCASDVRRTSGGTSRSM